MSSLGLESKAFGEKLLGWLISSLGLKSKTLGEKLLGWLMSSLGLESKVFGEKRGVLSWSTIDPVGKKWVAVFV